MARVYPFPADLADALDDLKLFENAWPDTLAVHSTGPSGLEKFFHSTVRGSRGSTFYESRLGAAKALADELGVHVFEYVNKFELYKAVFYAFGFSLASGEKELRESFSVLLVMSS